MRLPGFLLTLLLGLILACPGGGGGVTQATSAQPSGPATPPSQTPPSGPATPPSQTPPSGPATPPSQTPPSGPATPPSPQDALAALPQDFVDRHAHDPVYGPIIRAYQDQLQALKTDTSRFGDFEEVPPDGSAGYAEGYFSFQSRGQEFEYIDGIERPVIHSAAWSADLMVPVYEKLLSAKGNDWDPAKTRRVTAYLFIGSPAEPSQLAKTGGFWCQLMRPDPHNPARPTFAAIMDAPKSQTYVRDLSRAFNLASNLILIGTSHGGFVSLTRSVNVARYYASRSGSVGKPERRGYVYVALAAGGLDASQLRGMWQHEQEVAVPGMVPWSRVVAWRAYVVNPGTADHPAPPEFTGPLHVRAGLQPADPVAYHRIVLELSRKSLYTRVFEKGRDWRAKLSAFKDPAYVHEFRQAHPKVEASHPSLW